MRIDAGFAIVEDVDISGGDHTPSTDLFESGVSKGIYVGVSGDVKVDAPTGGAVTYVGLAAGVFHSIPCTKVYQTGTDATDIILGSW